MSDNATWLAHLAMLEDELDMLQADTDGIDGFGQFDDKDCRGPGPDPGNGLDPRDDLRLAIVGSTHFARSGALDYARQYVYQYIHDLRPAVIISGGARGIDTVVREVAAELGYTIEAGTFIEHRPTVPRWHGPGGYRDRNQRIATDCTELLAIRCRASTTYGSGWTADEAERQGKPVARVML